MRQLKASFHSVLVSVMLRSFPVSQKVVLHCVQVVSRVRTWCKGFGVQVHFITFFFFRNGLVTPYRS